MLDLLAKGTDRGYSMIGVGLSAGLSGSRRARTVQDPLPALDLDWATNRSLPASYGPTPSFSRASTGTYFDGQGILQTAAVNGPRFNHVFNGTSWVSKGLLIEEQRTNSCLRSQDLTATWSSNRGSISSNATTAPDGTLTADRFVENTATGVHGPVQFDIVTTNGAANTVSGFFKAGSRSVIVVRFQDNATGAHGVGAEFNLSNGTISVTALTIGGFSSPSASITNVGNGWYRCSVTGTVNTALCSLRIEACTTNGVLSSGSFNGSSYTGDGSSYFDSWGYQMEAGSFPTSYIGTTNSSVVRSADVCQITGSDFSGFWNGTEGSISVEFDRQFTPATIEQDQPFQFANSGGTNLIYGINKNGNERYVVYNGSIQVLLDSFAVAGANTSTKTAYGWKANDFAYTKDGAAVATDTAGDVPTGINRLDISNGGTFRGHIARLRYYPVRLSNAKLQELST